MQGSPGEVRAQSEDMPSYLKLYRTNLDSERNYTVWESQNWGDLATQQENFEVCCEKIDFHKQSVLDVGCGTGDFTKYLEERGVVPSLLRGIDGIPEFVEEAKKAAPSWAEYAVGDPLADPCVLGSEWDWVVALGIFGTQTIAETKRLLADCWPMARRGMAFSFFPAWYEEDMMAKPCDPGGTEELCPEHEGIVLQRIPPNVLADWAVEVGAEGSITVGENGYATIIMRRLED